MTETIIEVSGGKFWAHAACASRRGFRQVAWPDATNAEPETQCYICDRDILATAPVEFAKRPTRPTQHH